MNSAINILSVQKTPVQTQAKSAKQTADDILSFLSLLQNAANSSKIENADKLNYFQNNNLNKSSKMENKVKNNVLNNNVKVNDINNAEISLEDIVGNGGGLAAVLAKVLSGEAAELPEIDEVNLAEAVKKIIEGIIVEDENDEKIDITKLLEILGVPNEIIPDMIAAVIEPKVIVENVDKAENAESEQVREISRITAVKSGFEIKNETESAPILISMSEAKDFVAEAAEYIYSGRTAEMIGSAEAVSEQVQENIADFADIIEETGDFKSTIADYAVVKIEANEAAATVRVNTERLKEIIRQVLNDGQPEIEVLSAVKTSEAAAEKPVSTMFDILNTMRKAVNITQVQADSEDNGQEIANPIEFVSSTTEIASTTHEKPPMNETAEIKATDVNGANDTEVTEVNHLAGIVNAGVNTQNLENEVNIERFATNISQIISEKAQSILNQKTQGADETFELRLRLKPAELGEVFMKINYKNGNVGVSIIAANAVAERMILSQMGDLRASLHAQEIHLTEFDVNHFNNYNQNTQNQNSSQSNESNESKNSRSGSRRTGLNNNINEVQNIQEAERREAVANYIRSRRIFYKTI